MDNGAVTKMDNGVDPTMANGVVTTTMTDSGTETIPANGTATKVVNGTRPLMALWPDNGTQQRPTTTTNGLDRMLALGPVLNTLVALGLVLPLDNGLVVPTLDNGPVVPTLDNGLALPLDNGPELEVPQLPHMTLRK